jgi:hypothetical protein
MLIGVSDAGRHNKIEPAAGYVSGLGTLPPSSGFGTERLDRLLYRSMVINLDGDSYRLRDHQATTDNLRRATTGTANPGSTPLTGGEFRRAPSTVANLIEGCLIPLHLMLPGYDLYQPSTFGELRIIGGSDAWSRGLWSVLRLTPVNGETITADLVILGDEGIALAELRRITLRRKTRVATPALSHDLPHNRPSHSQRSAR